MSGSWIRDLMQENLVQEREMEELARIMLEMQEEIDCLKATVTQLEQELEEYRNAAKPTV